MHARPLHFIPAALLLSALSTLAVAQTPPADAGISGTGMAQIKKQPDLMRMSVDLRVDGKDLKDALAKSKTRTDDIKTKLTAMGATNIEFAPPVSGDPASSDRQAAMNRMMRGRNAGAPTTAPAAAPSVTITIGVRAEWPLTAADASTLLLTVTDLQNKVRAAKLFAPDMAVPGKTEEEQEETTMQMQSDPDQPSPGDPFFLYVARITDDDRATAAANAFKRAKAEALILSNAAGVELGNLRHLESQPVAAQQEYADEGLDYVNRFYQRSMYLAILRERSSGASEALSAQPGSVTYQVTVNATFGVK